MNTYIHTVLYKYIHTYIHTYIHFIHTCTHNRFGKSTILFE